MTIAQLHRSATPCAAKSCNRLTVPKDQWTALGSAEQARARSVGLHARRGDDMCARCYARTRRSAPKPKRTTIPREVVLEDYAFMMETGEIYERAAQRLGMTVEALDKALARAREDGDPRAFMRDNRRMEAA